MDKNKLSPEDLTQLQEIKHSKRIEKALKLWDSWKNVPEEYQNEIKGGKLKGFTDINPMWRIKKLTETFGLCGSGWYYDVVTIRREEGSDGVINCFVDINLYYKLDNGEWSKPIKGFGGNGYQKLEKGEIRSNDEAEKMAITDALSYACKFLGIGATIYEGIEPKKTKYATDNNQLTSKIYNTPPKVGVYHCQNCYKEFKEVVRGNKRYTPAEVKLIAEQNNIDGVARCKQCAEKLGKFVKKDG